MRWLRRLLLLAFGLGLVAAIVYGFMPRPPQVALAEVARGALQVTVREEGQTRVKDRYVISASVPGYVERVDLEVGDTVAQGQAIVTIKPLRAALLDARTQAEAEARVQVAEAQVKASEEQARVALSEAKLAEAELARLQELYAGGAQTRAELDRAQAAQRAGQARARSADFAVEVARHELEAARAALVYTSGGERAEAAVEVKAPLEARVLRVLRESEGVVAAGEPIVEIGDPSALEVEVEVLSADAVRIQAGMRAILDRWGGEPLEAVVRGVEPIGFTKVSALGVEEQRVRVIVDIRAPRGAWRELGDGYRVEATFVLWEGADVLLVPSSALFRGDEGWQVYVYRDGVAEARSVTLGKRGGLSAEVASGLEAGARVITHPDDQVGDGVAVRPRE